MAWEAANGRRVPEGMEVRHSCDNPPCVNPAHLQLGTHQDNMDDRTRRERQARGQRNPRAKLTPDQVREARELYATGAFTKTELGRRFGMSLSGMRQVLNIQTWKHVALAAASKSTSADECKVVQPTELAAG